MPQDQPPFGPIAFAPDSRTAAGVGLGWVDDPSRPGLIRLWDMAAGTKLLDVEMPGVAPRSVAFDRDGRTLYLASEDLKIRAHDLRTRTT
jgi:sugar lactone lactonase YvrE